METISRPGEPTVSLEWDDDGRSSTAVTSSGTGLGGDGSTLDSIVTEFRNFNQEWRVTPTQMDTRPVELIVQGAVRRCCLEIDLNVTPIYHCPPERPDTLWPGLLPVDKMFFDATSDDGFALPLFLNNRS